MTFEALRYRHPLHKKHADYWTLLTKLVNGGSQVDEEVKKELLVNPDKRDQRTIDKRVELAPFISFLGGIVMRLESKLLKDEAAYESPARDNDSFWDDTFFPKGGLDELGRVSFHAILKEATLNALTQQVAIAVVDAPFGTVETGLEEMLFGTNEPYVYLIKREQLWDWDLDSEGLKMAKIHQMRTIRKSWKDDPIPQHEFLIYEKVLTETGLVVEFSKFVIRPKDPKAFLNSTFNIEAINEKDVEIFAVVNGQEVDPSMNQPQTIFFVQEGNEQVFRFPVIVGKLPSILWVADQLFQPQKSLFNQNAAMEYSLFATNYAQLIFEEVADLTELEDRLGREGDGYYTALPTGVKASWLERDGMGIDKAKEFIKTRKDEMLTIVQQIAFEAAAMPSAVRRSGESKKEDRMNEEILLLVYGQYIAEFAKEILDVVSIARGTTDTWEVDGFNKYDSDSLMEDLKEYMTSEWVMNSPTLKIESMKKMSVQTRKALGVDDSFQPQIDEEIEGNNYFLDEDRLKALQELVTLRGISPQGVLELYKEAQILPDDFDVEEELRRLGIPNGSGAQTVNLGQLNDGDLLA